MFKHLPSKFRFLISSLLIFSIVIIAILLVSPTRLSAQDSSADENSNRISSSTIDGLFFFVENRGQFDPAVRFQAQTAQAPVWLTKESIWVSALESERSFDPNQPTASNLDTLRGAHFELSFIDANTDVTIEPFAPLATRFNYFMGQRADKWQTGLTAWQGVRYKNLYNGFDLEVTSAAGQLQLQLVATEQGIQAAQRASLSSVGLQVSGADRLSATGDQLILEAADLQMTIPLLGLVNGQAEALIPEVLAASQTRIEGNEIWMPFRTNVSAAAQLGPAIAQGEQASDPEYSLYLGGGDLDQAYGIDVDPTGRAIVVGQTKSLAFPTDSGSFDEVYNGGDDAFILRLGVTGRTLVYGTFLGGAGNESARAVEVDDGGSAYVVGLTNSNDFPVSANAYSTENQGNSDIFALKLTTSGDSFFFSTLIGGTGLDFPYDIALGPRSDIYVTGYTESKDFPTSISAYDKVLSGTGDAFVLRLRQSTEIDLIYSTLFGGFGDEKAYGIAVDQEGHAYVTGHTNSHRGDFPSTENAFDETYNGGQGALGDAFVTKVSLFGDDLVYSTFLGGSESEGIFADIAVADNGEAVVTGRTHSNNFPVTTDAYDTTYNGNADVYITRLNAAGSDLIYSTFVGGGSLDQGNAIHLDDLGNVTVAGPTLSEDFPIFSTSTFRTLNRGGVDSFIFKLGPNGQVPIDATYYGGEALDLISDMTADNDGNVYITGWTESEGFPAVVNLVGTNNGYSGARDGFVAKIHLLDNNENGIFPLAGRVVDANNQGFSNVDVTVGSVTKRTDSAGYYLFENVPLGIYRVTPQREGYDFSPAYSIVELDLDQVNEPNDFLARVAVSSIEPFLNLPIVPEQSGNTDVAILNALNDVSEGGRVLAWFDHAYPTGRRNQRLQLWDGSEHRTNFVYQNGACYMGRCYDGMNGIGFAPASREGVDQTIVAAADGTVIERETTCEQDQLGCGGNYGNYVVVDHENGYFTRYARLASVTAGIDANVASGDEVGMMGATGMGSGTYLHFTVHQDDGDGQWEGDSQDRVVDPFGWRGNRADPWVASGQGPISRWLWQMSPNSIFTLDNDTADGLSSVLGALTVAPNNSFNGEVELALTLGVSNLGLPSDGRVQIGSAFRLQPEQWISGIPISGTLQLTQPIEISIDLPVFASSDIDETSSHIEDNLTQASLYLWNVTSQRWDELSTSVDSANSLLTASTKRLGDFSIQAPLRCTADNNEPDDYFYSGRSTATAIPGQNVVITRVFDNLKDVDWFRIQAWAERSYDISTLDLANGVNTTVELYDQDGLTLLEQASANGEDGIAKIADWNAPHTGIYFVRLSPEEGSSVGCQANYGLTISHAGFNIYLPEVER